MVSSLECEYLYELAVRRKRRRRRGKAKKRMKRMRREVRDVKQREDFEGNCSEEREGFETEKKEIPGIGVIVGSNL